MSGIPMFQPARVVAARFQPAVLRLIRDVIAAAHHEGKWVRLCGELAGEPVAIPILLGLGLAEFRMAGEVMKVVINPQLMG